VVVTGTASVYCEVGNKCSNIVWGFHQYSIFTFNFILLLSEGRAGEARKLLTEQCSSGYRGALDGGKKSFHFARFEVPAVLKLRIQVFWLVR
jgi:hypothetical protein